jgi:hypothetical protein
MPWTESATSLSTVKSVVIDKQDGLQISAFQPFLTLKDANAGNMQARIQGADGKLVFYTQSALTTGVPTVVFNTLGSPAGQPLPSAVEIHAQDGVDTVGFQPFLTLTDANAGFAKARIQGADGKLVFYTQSALNAGAPTVVFNSLAVPGGQPLPSAIEIHAQDGVDTVGFQPFLTLTDANAGFAKARIQNANGDIVLYSQGGMNRAVPEMIVESASGDVHVTGTMKVDKDVLLTGSDCAERFDLAEQEELEAGTVVVIDQDGMLRTSSCAYDKCVAGVVAGAGEYRPAIVMGSVASDRIGALVALIGKTYCKVDASSGAIEVGDLLTVSSTPGHAMKASDPARAFGAVLGKALRPLRSGSGLIPILVALQ